MTNNTEPLKVGDDDYSSNERLGVSCLDGGACHHKAYCESERKCFRRVCCSPFSDHKGPWRYGEPSPAEADKALSQQSPARVEGELTFDIIEELLPEGSVSDDGLMGVTAQQLHDFAYRIERTLNQRLAVKEGEAEFLSKRLSRVAKLAGVKVPEGFTHEQVVEAAGTILGQIATSLSTHPAPDDQQAKDAALLRDLLEDARDDVNECLNGMMHLAGYPSGDKKIARQREFLARIDAALSTTKQEEV